MLNCRGGPPAYLMVRTVWGSPAPRAHFGQPLVWRVARSIREPRRTSLAEGRRLRSRSRAWMACLCVIYIDDTLSRHGVNTFLSFSLKNVRTARRSNDSSIGRVCDLTVLVARRCSKQGAQARLFAPGSS